MSLWGAKARFEAEFRNHVTSAWLAGMLSQCPPAQYPKLESLIGGEAEKPKQIERPSAEDSAANARAWAAWLRSGR